MFHRIRFLLFATLVAGLTNIGLAQTLKVTQWAPSTAQGGTNIQAEYDLGPSPWCPPEKVRWLQRILLKEGDGTTQKNNVPGYPSGNFIDPQPTQPGGPWDNNPWYDVTYNSAANRATDTNRQNGAGRFFNDSPGGWGPFGPMYFCAQTAIVCIDETTKVATYMGGFTWGFCVSATGAITGIAPAAMPNNAATVADFNGALAAGPASFRAWTVAVGDPQCQLTFSSVPEPSAMAGLGIGIAALALRRRRARKS